MKAEGLQKKESGLNGDSRHGTERESSWAAQKRRGPERFSRDVAAVQGLGSLFARCVPAARWLGCRTTFHIFTPSVMMQANAEATGSNSSTPHREIMSSPREYDVGQVLLSLMGASSSNGNPFANAALTDDADEAAPAPASRVFNDKSQQTTSCGLCGKDGMKLRVGHYGNVQVVWKNDHDTLTCDPCYRLVLSARKLPNDAKMLALFATPERPAISEIDNLRRYLVRKTRKASAKVSYKIKSNRGAFNFKADDRRSDGTGKNDQDTEEDTDCDDEYASDEDRDRDDESDHDRPDAEPSASSTVPEVFNSGAANFQPPVPSAFSTAKCGICRIEDPAQNEFKQNRYPFPLALGVDWGIAKSAAGPLCKSCYRMAFKVLSIKASTEPGRKISETHRARCLAFVTEVGNAVLHLSQRTDISQVEALRENVNEFELAGRDDTAHDKAARNRAATRLALNLLSTNSQKSSAPMPMSAMAAAGSSKRSADAAMPLPPQAMRTRSFTSSSPSASSSDEHFSSDAIDSNFNRELSSKRQKQAAQHELFSDSFPLHRSSSSQSHHDVEETDDRSQDGYDGGDGEDDDESSGVDSGNASKGGVDDTDIKSMPETNEQHGLQLALAPSQSAGVSDFENCEIAMEIQDDDESISESERQFRRLARAQAIMLTEKAIIIEQQRLQIRNLLHLKEAAYATMYQLAYEEAVAAAQHVMSSTASRQSSSSSSKRNSPPLSSSVPSFFSSPSSSEQESIGASDRRNELDGPVFIPSVGDIVFVNEPNQTQAFEVEVTSVDERAATASFKYCDRNYRHYGEQSCSLVYVFRNAPDRRTRRRTSTSTASVDDEADEA
jgi:hypothetical protein